MSRILLVEDDPLLSIMLAETLHELGHEVDRAGNGLEALQLFRAGVFDAVITDYVMPFVSGGTLIDQIRDSEINSDVPILLTSGAMPEKVKVADLPVQGFLRKPFDDRELAEALERIL